MATFGRMWDAGFARVERGYAHLLRVALPRRWLVIGVGCASFAAGLSLVFLGLVGLDFFPSGDQSELDITLTMPPATTLDATNAVAKQVERELRAYPEVRSLYSVVGRSATGSTNGALGGGSNQAQITALLVARAERNRSVAVLAEDVRQRLEGQHPGAKLRIGMPNAFGFGGFGGAPIQVQVQGSDPAVVSRLATQIQQVAAAVPGAVGIDNSDDNLQTQLRARVDWTRAADLGVTPRDAGAVLRTALDGFTANATQFRQAGKSSIPIRVLTADAAHTSTSDIARLPVNGVRGPVELGQFVTFERVRIPTAIAHVNRLRSVTVGVNAGQGHLVGDLQNSIQKAVASVTLPSGYSVTYAGNGQQGGSAFGDMARAMTVAVLLMYMLMMMLFRSVTLPLAVLMSLPLAMIGALGAMAIAHSAFTLFSMLGVAVLLGLVGKNAILLVDRTARLRESGVSRFEALLEAGPSRLRPIVMTTLSVMAALLPIASGLEEGSELLQSVALVLIGGLLTSTLLTLVFVPAMYTVFDDIQTVVQRLVRWRPTSDEAPPVHLDLPLVEPAPAANT
jgi:HAE1 family hydrophobic/amphiphilic exporter-1